MDETVLSVVLLPFALGFFIFIMSYANKSLNQDNERDYRRGLNERREFGFEPERPPGKHQTPRSK